MMDQFKEDNKEIAISYDLEADYSELIQKYRLNDIAGNGNDYEKMLNLLFWETSHIKHKGNYDGHIENSALKLFEYSFDSENGINCRSLSFALAECLLAVKIKARVVYLFPFSPYDGDNHVVCEAWSEHLNKWIMLDPTYGTAVYYHDVPKSVCEVRGLLALRKQITFSENANYNGVPFDAKELQEYYAKDMFWLRVSSMQGCNTEAEKANRGICIVPEGYDIISSKISLLMSNTELR